MPDFTMKGAVRMESDDGSIWYYDPKSGLCAKEISGKDVPQEIVVQIRALAESVGLL